jgi:acyl phosphate:glycerol-3-phosphate acyltransferase
MSILGKCLLPYGLLLFAYLLGSIPWGLILTRLFTAVDIRRQGSGNIGAANVARVAGAGPGLATLAADILKGWLPVFLVSMAVPATDEARTAWTAAAALLAFCGHLFPAYTGFRGGGKGVATAAGGFGVIAPSAVGLAAGVFLLTFGLCRRASASSLAAAAILPFAVFFTTHSTIAGLGALLTSLLIAVRHRDNIRRLRSGTEPRFRIKR